MSRVIAFLIGFREGVKDFALNISTLINSLLLSIVYILGIGATWLVSKATKKGFLKMEQSERTKSYWTKKDLKKEKLENYYRQF